MLFVQSLSLGFLNGILKNSVHLVLRYKASNMEKAMRDAVILHHGCFTHSLPLIISDGVLTQWSPNELLAICRRIVGNFKRSIYIGIWET